MMIRPKQGSCPSTQRFIRNMSDFYKVELEPINTELNWSRIFYSAESPAAELDKMVITVITDHGKF